MTGAMSLLSRRIPETFSARVMPLVAVPLALPRH